MKKHRVTTAIDSHQLCSEQVKLCLTGPVALSRTWKTYKKTCKVREETHSLYELSVRAGYKLHNTLLQLHTVYKHARVLSESIFGTNIGSYIGNLRA